MLRARMKTTPPARIDKAARARTASRSAAHRKRKPQPTLFHWAGIEDAPRAAAPQQFDPKKLTQIASYIWRASVPVAGTLGERFFASRRLPVPGPSVVRFHHSLKNGDERSPGLVWLLLDERTRKACGVARVYLAADGSTVIGKRVLGRSVGASINHEPRPP